MVEQGLIEPSSEESEGPVPHAWRATLEGVVSSMVRRDFVLASNLPAVESPSPRETRDLLHAVEDYGEVTLVPLPEDAWDTSVCSWRGDHWECLVDLWTEEEGRSDLVMSVNVIERDGTFRYSVNLVYVP